jgi:hypothetical protein
MNKRYFRGLGGCVESVAIVAIALAIVAASSGRCRAASPPAVRGPLLALGTAEFSNLTRAERALLVHADLKNRASSDFAVAGTVANPADPSNDPVHADHWDHEREVRAELIRWMCVDPDATKLVDPRGIRLLGAKVTGALDLSHVRVSFGIAMIRCRIPSRMNLESAALPMLDLNGSSIAEIYAPSLDVQGDLALGGFGVGGPFQASGEVNLEDSRIGGIAGFAGGHFRSTPPNEMPPGQLEAAIDLWGATIGGALYLCCGLQAQGPVVLHSTKVQGLLTLANAHLYSHTGPALDALALSVGGDVYLSEIPWVKDSAFVVDGLVSLVTAHIDGAPSMCIRRSSRVTRPLSPGSMRVRW